MAKRAAAPSPEPTVRDTIGALMRDIRKRRRMTLERLSELTGISVSSLSRIENTQLGLNIEKVEKLAAALGVSPESLVSRARPGLGLPADGPSARELRFLVDRASRRQPNAERELRIEYLFERSRNRSLDCMHLNVQAISIWDSEFVRHPGEKILYVIAGEAVVYCQGRPPLVLEAGDSLYMDGAVWHSVVAANGREAELLVTIYSGPDAAAGLFETQFFTAESWAAPPSG